MWCVLQICFNFSWHLYYGCLQSNFGDGGHWIRKFDGASLTTAYEIYRMDKHFAFSLFCFYYRDRICQLSSSHAFKVLKDIQAVDQTISKYSDLRFSWCRISLSCKLMSIFMALKSIYISYNFHQDYPGFGFTKKMSSLFC